MLLGLHAYRAFRSRKYLIEMVWYYIEFYKISRTLHGRLEIRNFRSRVELTRGEISHLQVAM